MRPQAGLLLVSLLTFPILACHPTLPLAPDEPGLAGTVPPSVFVEQRSAPLPGVVELGPACPPELSPAPSAFFRDHLIIRLPLGVESEQITEQLWISRSERPLAMGCEPKLAASVFVSHNRFGHEQLAPAREYLFHALDFPDEREVVILRGSDADADVSMAISFPDHAAWGPIQVYVRTFSRHGYFHAVGFITERSDYHRLEPVFAASAASMLAVPQ
jgi:hypothetical protein